MSRSVLRHRHPTPADAGRHVVVGQAEVLDELLVGGGFLERVEVVAVDVLDQRLLERGGVVGLAHQRRNGLQPDPPGRPPPPLPRDELVLPVARRAHEHRLEHADLADRVGELARAPPRRSDPAAGTGSA